MPSQVSCSACTPQQAYVALLTPVTAACGLLPSGHLTIPEGCLVPMHADTRYTPANSRQSWAVSGCTRLSTPAGFYEKAHPVQRWRHCVHQAGWWPSGLVTPHAGRVVDPQDAEGELTPLQAYVEAEARDLAGSAFTAFVQELFATIEKLVPGSPECAWPALQLRVQLVPVHKGGGRGVQEVGLSLCQSVSGQAAPAQTQSLDHGTLASAGPARTRPSLRASARRPCRPSAS